MRALTDKLEPILRIATPRDGERIVGLTKASAAGMFPAFYSVQQTEAAIEYVAKVDPDLLVDGTYFVLESGREMVACGGWSRRDRLYTGSGDAAGDSRVLDPHSEPA